MKMQCSLALSGYYSKNSTARNEKDTNSFIVGKSVLATLGQEQLSESDLLFKPL